MFLSFLHAMYLGCYLDYAADNEWSRNLVLNLIIWGGQVGIIIGDFIYSAGLISFYNTNYDDTSIKVFSASSPTCNTLFQINMYGYLVVAIIMSILAILQMWKIIDIGKNFFMKNYVEHTARCEDENIIVIS
jgi:hypothetical protein